MPKQRLVLSRRELLAMAAGAGALALSHCNDHRLLAADVPKPTPGSDAPTKESFTPLFDGKTFDGWEGNREVFRIEQGCLVGGSLAKPVAHNEFLCTTKEFGEFELKLKCKLLGKGANAGIQVRSRRVPNHFEMSGYQADMGESAGQVFWGGLYDESRRNRILAGPPAAERGTIVKPEDWNDYVIRCEGRRIQLWLNGEKTVDYMEADPSIPRRGLIGLQIHGGPPSEAWYKDIAIRLLSPNA
jgi:hypothetical protein